MKPEYAGHGCEDGEGEYDDKGEDDIPAPETEPEEDQGGVLGYGNAGDEGGEECVDDRDNDKVACVSFRSSSRICQKDSTRAEEKSPYLVRDYQYHCAIAPFS